MEQLAKFGEYTSQKLKVDFGESIFLDSKFNSAIVGYDSVTGAIIYSLSSLVDGMVEESKSEGLSNHFDSEACLYRFWIEFFKSDFEELDEMDDGIPPILISDLNYIMKAVEFNIHMPF